jgi:hypothetical protein
MMARHSPCAWDTAFRVISPFSPMKALILTTLLRDIDYLRGAERLQIDVNTLTCRVDRGGAVLISFFGGLGLDVAAPAGRAQGSAVAVASLLDIAGTKAAVVQKPAQEMDYIDIDALLRSGIDLSTMLAAGSIVDGHEFNPLITLKALSYFADVPKLPPDVRQRLAAAVSKIEPSRLPTLTPYKTRKNGDGEAS